MIRTVRLMPRKRAVGSYLPGRDLGIEADLLTTIDRLAATAIGYGFGAAVVSRLDLGERRYGNAFVGRTVPDLLGEAIEEAVDLPAWAALAYQQAVRLDTDQSTLDALRQMIVSAGVAAAHAHVELDRAMTTWNRAQR